MSRLSILFQLLMVVGLLFPMAHASLGQCGDTTHTTLTADTWVSCQPSPNPNPARGTSHWIRYDFGQVYSLSNTHFWNANVPGETDQGFRQTAIDYSLDGSQWVSLGTFEMPRASGYNSYTGTSGPDFGDVSARYVVLTALSNWGHASCSGLAEVRFGLTGAVSNDPLQSAQSISLYPNPASAMLRIGFGDIRPVNLRVVNLEGRIVQEYSGQIPDEIQVDRLSPGIYFVSVIDAQGSYYSRGFVKE